MAIPPETPRGFWGDFAPIFTRPTFRRFLTLLGAAILTIGGRTVANLLRTAGSLAPGATARRVVDRLPADDHIMLVGDDTVFAHPGRHVFGKARHRDQVRSSHAFTA